MQGSSPHGPNEWEFVWKDNQTGATHRIPAWIENYFPSLDTVRKAGEFRVVSVAEAFPVAQARPVGAVKFGEVKQLAAGYQQADTPAVLP